MKELLIENDVTYNKKTIIAVKLLQKRFKTKELFEKEYKLLQANLNEIGRVRNVFAHGRTALPLKADIDTYKIAVNHKLEHVHFTTEQLKSHLKLIEKCKGIFDYYFDWKRLK